MDDFLELGLEVCDKAIDKGFDKLPDRIVSPLGADIPHPHLFHRNKEGELVNQKGQQVKDNKQNREREHNPNESASQRAREEKRRPARSATMPPGYNGRPRGRDSEVSNNGENGYRSNRAIDRRPSRNDRNGYAPSQSSRRDPHVPNPKYDNRVSTRPRPLMTSRRSQSYQPPRERRRGDRTPSPTSSVTGTPPPANKAEKVASNPFAAGAIGALAGGLLANQAGKATGIDTKRRSKSQSSSSRRPGEGDEALMTLAGMVLGGVTAAFGSERYKKFRSRKYEESQLWEKNQNNDGRLAQEDWDREHHENERDSPVEGWARSQADAYPDQIKEARRWQAQVEAGERERERIHRDDVVVLEDGRRREQQKVYRQERIYQPQPEYVTRQVVDVTEEPISYERRSRRRSVDDSRYDARRREMDIRDNNYGFESRQRERYVVSGGR